MLGVGRSQIGGAGHFYSIDGRVQVQRPGKADWQTAQNRMPVFNGDFVRTGRDGSAEILFEDGSCSGEFAILWFEKFEILYPGKNV